MISVYKQVEASEQKPYLNAGWSVSDELCNIIHRTLPNEHTMIKNEIFISLKKPDLIQRGNINRPMLRYSGSPITGAVSLHYTGNRMFEGMLTHSLLSILAQFFKYEVYVVPSLTRSIKGKPCALRVFGCFDTDAQKEEYIEHLTSLYSGDLPVHEWAAFDRDSAIADFWWDLTNNVLFTFDRNFMERLPLHLQASFNKL